MNRAIFLVVALGVMFGLYRCAMVKPEQTKYHAMLTTEITRIADEENPLCRDIPLVEGFPFVAGLEYRGFQSGYASEEEAEDAPRPGPHNPLSVKWRDLVAAGLLTEAEKLDLDLNLVGYEYDLTPRGREFYSQRSLPTDKTMARFCLGKTVLKQINAISKPVYSIEGLNVTAKYVLQVPSPGPDLYGDVAQAL
ncbi:MAG TPA: hypothetical protein VF050_05455, partial [Moraxellaceae bacterium]